ncbi:monosaccharide-p-dolichol utilization protein [Polyplosphaeria fusca]|uniref:Mannose-P-dolichol utilization defect 1 protein homolog n=1 Tax=Polyplosphaeria fusca TaxID=682080 RepID=A0A9P4V3G4_9PLEO|nr:monosaccharide-p-dolichol utilization protein [Polyplosphaeria fusca]
METLRSALQPLTQSLPAPIVDTGRSLLGPYCYKTLILDIDPFTSPECLKLAVSKALGIGIIGASSIVKIPQLLKLLNSQSAAGISFLAYLLESGAYLISLSYNVRHGFPFSTYGETALILVQNVVIAALVLRYSGQNAAVAAWVGGLAAAGAALFREDIVDVRMLAWLQAGAGVLGVLSKVPQIATIWAEGGTGQLSAFAVVNYLLGSLSRIFTTLQEVPDPLILYGFIAGFALNAVLFLQVVWYWNSPTGKKTGAKKVNKPVGAAKADGTSSSTSYASKAKSPSTRRRG